MQSFPRGATVQVSVQFLDVDGNVTSPASATAYLYYRAIAGARATASISLSSSGSNWVGSWDSRVAQSGIISGHVRTADPTPISALNFSFALESNPANPSS